jgi:hypothetical protein
MALQESSTSGTYHYRMLHSKTNSHANYWAAWKTPGQAQYCAAHAFFDLQ